ncbi:LysR family transcriptional regulator [Lactiplantibacillus garii]|uniref:LysR family transcriptional regulator n=1 Tax=Lactiplantibacillus garii TaxID=2306423 RepID=A0A426D3Q0_9LACO|nr:LysR family transcriptional regulator [Lactiplantibacillus garii]RRK09295.1 LysR family transcriptional regulator [Lactiplantibacillus garii]
METRRLAVFVDLAETLNYSRSAERLFLSQSTISKDIMFLEKTWRVKLFIRAHRQVKLTRAGQLILPKVKRVLKREADLNQAITGRFWQQERPLVIKGLPSLPQYQAFQIITGFTKQYPDIKLCFSEAGVDQLAHALDQKNVDVVFTRIFDQPASAYDTLVNEADQLVVLVPKSNPLAHRAYLTLDMLESESILLQSDTVSKNSPLFAALRDLKLQPRVTYNGQRIELILAMLNQGAGISVVMNRSFDLTGFDNIQVVPLVPKISSRLAFMKRRDNPAAVVDLFWKYATDETRRLR